MNSTLYIVMALPIIFVLVMLKISSARTKNERQKQHNAIEGYVGDIFSEQTYRPEVITHTSYGAPAFRLKFKTDEEKQLAISSGLTEQFLGKIQELYGHLRVGDQEFDAKRAVAIYSEEDEKRWAQKAEAHRKKGK